MFNYKNIGNKIKGLAKAAFIVEAIAAVISAIAMIADDEDMIPFGILIIIAGPIVAWVSSWLLYGFGELIDKVCLIASAPKLWQLPFVPTNNPGYQATMENNRNIASTFNTNGIMDIPKRNQ